MKTRKKNLLIVLLLITNLKIYSQKYFYDEIREKDIFINKNIKISTDTNYILKKYGKPLERIVNIGDGLENYGGISYKYDGLIFSYINEMQEIGTFSIINSNYSINIKNKEEIRVGDNVEKLKKIFKISYKNYITHNPEIKSYKEYKILVVICYNKPTEERGKYAYNIGFTIKNNIIIRIGVSSYNYMDLL